MKYRKRPVVIEAEQWFPGRTPPGICWCARPHPPAAVAAEVLYPHVHTLEGTSYQVAEGDWIIKGIKGEYYPCKPDVFKATYSPFPSPGLLTDTGEMEMLAADLVSAWEAAYRDTPGGPGFETSIIVPRLYDDPAQVVLRPWAPSDAERHREQQGHAPRYPWHPTEKPDASPDAGR